MAENNGRSRLSDRELALLRRIDDEAIYATWGDGQVDYINAAGPLPEAEQQVLRRMSQAGLHTIGPGLKLQLTAEGELEVAVNHGR